ncbi:hypothetical protein GGF32_004319 [Allomyces javanicus]|nr:hypothetical protein GGF32_004319 [Allomyces javanicus]
MRQHGSYKSAGGGHHACMESVLNRLPNLSHVLFLTDLPHQFILPIFSHPNVGLRVNTVHIFVQNFGSNVSYLAEVPALPNITTFCVQSGENRDLEISAIPVMPQCQVLELLGFLSLAADLAKLPHLKHLNMPVEEPSYTTLPLTVSDADTFFPSLVMLMTNVHFFTVFGDRLFPVLESLTICLSKDT